MLASLIILIPSSVCHGNVGISTFPAWNIAFSRLGDTPAESLHHPLFEETATKMSIVPYAV